LDVALLLVESGANIEAQDRVSEALNLMNLIFQSCSNNIIIEAPSLVMIPFLRCRRILLSLKSICYKYHLCRAISLLLAIVMVVEKKVLQSRSFNDCVSTTGDPLHTFE
jgi:hypothetical protein